MTLFIILYVVFAALLVWCISNSSRKDPLKEKLKQAKKIKRAKENAFWKEQERKRKEEKRIYYFLGNNICPSCGEPVELKQETDATCTTDNHYKCTKCTFSLMMKMKANKNEGR